MIDPPNEMDHATSQRFTALSGRVGITDEQAGTIFGELKNLYSEAHRAYHNLSHIDRMLAWLDEAGSGSESIELAIWFHDAIYNPRGAQNEAKSAQYFTDRLGSFIGGHLAADVERLIIATEHARPRSGKDDEELIIDIDLSILGSPPNEYEAYRSAVRSEYSFVPERDFVAGRRAILEGFLSQRIYSTRFFAKLEEQARANIADELESL
jgi:predicted metal-dependent HD superfamily phosphohydrolase